MDPCEIQCAIFQARTICRGVNKRKDYFNEFSDESLRLKTFYSMLRSTKRMCNCEYCRRRRQKYDCGSKEMERRKKKELILLQLMCASLDKIKAKLRNEPCKDENKVRDRVLKECLCTAIEMLQKSKDEREKKPPETCTPKILPYEKKCSKRQQQVDKFRKCHERYAKLAARRCAEELVCKNDVDAENAKKNQELLRESHAIKECYERCEQELCCENEDDDLTGMSVSKSCLKSETKLSKKCDELERSRSSCSMGCEGNSRNEYSKCKQPKRSRSRCSNSPSTCSVGFSRACKQPSSSCSYPTAYSPKSRKSSPCKKPKKSRSTSSCSSRSSRRSKPKLCKQPKRSSSVCSSSSAHSRKNKKKSCNQPKKSRSTSSCSSRSSRRSRTKSSRQSKRSSSVCSCTSNSSRRSFRDTCSEHSRRKRNKCCKQPKRSRSSSSCSSRSSRRSRTSARKQPKKSVSSCSCSSNSSRRSFRETCGLTRRNRSGWSKNDRRKRKKCKKPKKSRSTCSYSSVSSCESRKKSCGKRRSRSKVKKSRSTCSCSSASSRRQKKESSRKSRSCKQPKKSGSTCSCSSKSSQNSRSSKQPKKSGSTCSSPSSRKSKKGTPPKSQSCQQPKRSESQCSCSSRCSQENTTCSGGCSRKSRKDTSRKSQSCKQPKKSRSVSSCREETSKRNDACKRPKRSASSNSVETRKDCTQKTKCCEPAKRDRSQLSKSSHPCLDECVRKCEEDLAPKKDVCRQPKKSVSCCTMESPRKSRKDTCSENRQTDPCDEEESKSRSRKNKVCKSEKEHTKQRGCFGKRSKSECSGSSSTIVSSQNQACKPSKRDKSKGSECSRSSSPEKKSWCPWKRKKSKDSSKSPAKTETCAPKYDVGDIKELCFDEDQLRLLLYRGSKSCTSNAAPSEPACKCTCPKPSQNKCKWCNHKLSMKPLPEEECQCCCFTVDQCKDCSTKSRKSGKRKQSKSPKRSSSKSRKSRKKTKVSSSSGSISSKGSRKKDRAFSKSPAQSPSQTHWDDAQDWEKSKQYNTDCPQTVNYIIVPNHLVLGSSPKCSQQQIPPKAEEPCRDLTKQPNRKQYCLKQKSPKAESSRYSPKSDLGSPEKSKPQYELSALEALEKCNNEKSTNSQKPWETRSLGQIDDDFWSSYQSPPCPAIPVCQSPCPCPCADFLPFEDTQQWGNDSCNLRAIRECYNFEAIPMSNLECGQNYLQVEPLDQTPKQPNRKSTDKYSSKPTNRDMSPKSSFKGDCNKAKKTQSRGPNKLAESATRFQSQSRKSRYDLAGTSCPRENRNSYSSDQRSSESDRKRSIKRDESYQRQCGGEANCPCKCPCEEQKKSQSPIVCCKPTSTCGSMIKMECSLSTTSSESKGKKKSQTICCCAKPQPPPCPCKPQPPPCPCKQQSPPCCCKSKEAIAQCIKTCAAKCTPCGKPPPPCDPGLMSDVSLTSVFRNMLVVLRPDLMRRQNCRRRKSRKRLWSSLATQTSTTQRSRSTSNCCEEKRRLKCYIKKLKDLQTELNRLRIERDIKNDRFQRYNIGKVQQQMQPKNSAYSSEAEKPIGQKRPRKFTSSSVSAGIKRKRKSAIPTWDETEPCKQAVNTISPERWCEMKKKLKVPKYPKPLPNDFVLDSRLREDPEVARCRALKRQKQLDEWQQERRAKEVDQQNKVLSEVCYICKPVKPEFPETSTDNLRDSCLYECTYCQCDFKDAKSKVLQSQDNKFIVNSVKAQPSVSKNIEQDGELQFSEHSSQMISEEQIESETSQFQCKCPACKGLDQKIRTDNEWNNSRKPDRNRPCPEVNLLYATGCKCSLCGINCCPFSQIEKSYEICQYNTPKGSSAEKLDPMSSNVDNEPGCSQDRRAGGCSENIEDNSGSRLWLLRGPHEEDQGLEKVDFGYKVKCDNGDILEHIPFVSDKLKKPMAKRRGLSKRKRKIRSKQTKTLDCELNTSNCSNKDKESFSLNVKYSGGPEHSSQKENSNCETFKIDGYRYPTRNPQSPCPVVLKVKSDNSCEPKEHLMPRKFRKKKNEVYGVFKWEDSPFLRDNYSLNVTDPKYRSLMRQNRNRVKFERSKAHASPDLKELRKAKARSRTPSNLR